jgi:hypothetical protein
VVECWYCALLLPFYNSVEGGETRVEWGLNFNLGSFKFSFSPVNVRVEIFEPQVP